jgi:uncharacterized protein DUF6894
MVPRYYFHFSDGKRRFSDAEGVTLSGMGAARAYAINQVRDLKAAMCDPGIQDLSGWSMIVVDADEHVVFETGFDLKLQAARG